MKNQNLTRKTLFSLLALIFLFSCSDQATKAPFEYVDPFIGTGGHGHTFPGATMPFGMVQLSPDTRLTGWDGCSGYHYTDSIVYGFSHTHLSGTGISDYGDVLIMPYTGTTYYHNGADGKLGYRSHFSKETEEAAPGYYSVNLSKDNIKVELTASERVGFHQYTFNGSKDRKLIIDLDHRDNVLASSLKQVNDYELTGFRHSKAWAEKQYVFFRIIFDQPIQSMTYGGTANGVKAALSFGEGPQLKVKTAISAVDEEGASKNLEAEIQYWDFEKARQEARQSWEKQLNKIMVEGGNDKQQRIFYTAFYHTMIAPNLYHDVDGRYRSTDLKVHLDTTFTNHTVFSLWDTYRSTHPLYTILERERTTDFIRTFLKQYQHGGRLPMWELAGNYTNCMIGYHAVPTIADAYVKGIRGFDEELALEAMIHSSMQDRLGIDHFRNQGFIPSDLEAESVSKTLEYAYDDWTIAEMADQMSESEIAANYYERAQYYKNVFDSSTGFMRARNNNRWFFPFEPAEVNVHYTEANSWQYSYYVPQDVETWIDLLGGDEAAEQKLDELFSAESETSGRVQADITGLIGQYAHGNEPSHHISYLYNFVGRPDKTQQLVRQIMEELYSDQPDGLSGNEDCGQMSSWLVMSAMGFYPVTPGSVDYIIGSPWFDRVTLNLENGKQFVVEAKDNGPENVYVESIELNGSSHPFSYLTHDDIMQGGKMTFFLSDQPSEFWKAKEHRPKSKIESEIVSIPALETGDHAFLESTTITLSTPTKGAEIYYSFTENGGGIKYEAPFEINESTDLFVWAEKDGKQSLRAKSEFYKIPEKRNITLGTEYANHYTAGGGMALIDFIRGGKDFRTGAWQGYHQVDLEAIVDLGSVRNFNTVKIGFLQDENAWIFMPTEVQFWVSNDGEAFRQVGRVENDIPYLEKGAILKDFGINKSISGRYVKVIAKNRGICPPDHKGAGDKAWIFADEIVIN
ncbi:GH92 family glycosyl hydrolase [Ekhidna sp.]|uniref:GH92 family glycosyl hydrolase n=1 Tax=Ekhidna sp. TaxID=2608089 RepID=UPI003B5BE7E1